MPYSGGQTINVERLNHFSAKVKYFFPGDWPSIGVDPKNNCDKLTPSRGQFFINDSNQLTEESPMLSDREAQRYDRQIMIQGFGEEGQEKLKKSRVLIAGAGGLGSPAAIYLAAAGIGALRLVDRDRVELSNLNRQILHWEEDLGRYKAESGQGKLSRLNPEVTIETVREEIREDNLGELMEGCNLILDGLDNFPTRYLINRFIQKTGIPYIYGGILGLMGMTTFIQPGRTPCLKCLFPQAPEPKKFPVLGTTPGIIGLIEAHEAIKFLVGLGNPLSGRLLVYNGLEMRFSEVRIERNPECPVCAVEKQNP
jgi:molybdopterin-synthase adenylyltransferase